MVVYEKLDLSKYKRLLRSSGSLSRLFSESDSPYLVSRSVENIYCHAFAAENLGRADCSVDAKYRGIGVGIKTFLHGNGKTLQKVAEFNKFSNSYRKKSAEEMVFEIARLRNERLKFTLRTYDLSSMIYHCITREPNKILIFEEPMDFINISSINSISSRSNTISFSDNKNEYSFNITKSTLYKRFYFDRPLLVIDVPIIKGPFNALEQISNCVAEVSIGFNTEIDTTSKYSAPQDDTTHLEYVILPLFSERGVLRNVPEKSGLNQWNANGRSRDPNEIYIPIPKWIHSSFPSFFPPRDSSFSLEVPSGAILDAKVCQQDSKALMTNPNKALGAWLLRNVLNLTPGQLLTYEMLEDLDIDSVIVIKKNSSVYTIDFRKLGSYDEFKLNNYNKKV